MKKLKLWQRILQGIITLTFATWLIYLCIKGIKGVIGLF